MIRTFAVAAAILCFACSAFADHAVIAAFKARIEKSDRLDEGQKAVLIARTRARLASMDLGPDRRNHAARVVDKMVSSLFEGRLVLTTAERFPTAADIFESSLAGFIATKPYTERERETTAANWNAAAKGADIVIDSAMGELPPGLRARIKKAVAAELSRSPRDFGTYMGQGVWSGDALSAEEAAKAVATNSSFEIFMRSALASTKWLLSDAKRATELAEGAEETTVRTMTRVVSRAFEDLLRNNLDTNERIAMAIEAFEAVEGSQGLQERYEKLWREAAEEADQRDRARQPAAVPAEPPKQPVKDAGGVPKPAIDG
jgi:hypothetical protein